MEGEYMMPKAEDWVIGGWVHGDKSGLPSVIPHGEASKASDQSPRTRGFILFKISKLRQQFYY
jgi:hypothetical protein